MSRAGHIDHPTVFHRSGTKCRTSGLIKTRTQFSLALEATEIGAIPSIAAEKVDPDSIEVSSI